MPTPTRTDTEGPPPYAAPLRALAEAKGLTHRALAEATGMHMKNVGEILRGETDPRGRQLRRLLEALGATEADLVGESPPSGGRKPPARKGKPAGGKDKEYVVESGHMMRAVTARGYREAAVKAVREEVAGGRPRRLGELCCITRAAGGARKYLSTVDACKEAGVWAVG